MSALWPWHSNKFPILSSRQAFQHSILLSCRPGDYVLCFGADILYHFQLLYKMRRAQLIVQPFVKPNYRPFHRCLFTLHSTKATCNGRHQTLLPDHDTRRREGASRRREQVRRKSTLDHVVGQEKEKQTKAPWHREGSDIPPVARQRSAGAMTKGRC